MGISGLHGKLLIGAHAPKAAIRANSTASSIESTSSLREARRLLRAIRDDRVFVEGVICQCQASKPLFVAGPNETIRYVDYVEGDGAAMLKAACTMEVEGIVSKQLNSAYRGGPSHDRQKDQVRSQRNVRSCRLWRRQQRPDRRHPPRPSRWRVAALCRRRRPGAWRQRSGRARPVAVTPRGHSLPAHREAARQERRALDTARGAGRGAVPQQAGRQPAASSQLQGLPG
jgi:hypothetical protein